MINIIPVVVITLFVQLYAMISIFFICEKHLQDRIISGDVRAKTSLTPPLFNWNTCTKPLNVNVCKEYQVRVITVFTVFRLLTDFVCLYNYEFWLSLCKIVRSSVILLLPLFAPFLLTIVLSVLLRYMDSDYPFGIFKLFLDICLK
jgi:hypothetical protein